MRLLLIRNNDAADGGMSAFHADFGMPAKQAVDTPAPPPTVPKGETIDAGGGFFRIKENVEVEQPPTPVFKEAVEAEQETKKPATTVKGASIETFLKVRNSLQAELFALTAKSKTPEKYLLSDEQLDLLAEAYAPYADSITGMLPPWVMIIAVEAITTGKMLLMAMDDRKQAIRNEKVAAGVVAPSTQSKPTALDLSRPRTRFKIRTTGQYAGTYQQDRFGNHVKKEDPGETVALDNIEHMKEVIFTNGWSTVREIFKLPADFREKNGISTEE